MIGLFETSRVLIVAGKGGVGRTTLGATIGVAAASRGRDVLLVEVGRHSAVGPLFDVGPLGTRPTSLYTTDTGHLRGQRLTPDAALLDYLANHGLNLVAGRLLRTGAAEVAATAAPGIQDLLTLGKLRHLASTGSADLIIVDAPAAGHALAMLRAPINLAKSADAGPIRSQADAALAMLRDSERCRVVLVTLPEPTPVLETVETAFTVEDEIGVQFAPVVINGVWPDIEGLVEERAASPRPRSAVAVARRDAADYRLERARNQRDAIDLLDSELPLPKLELPQLFTPVMGVGQLETLAKALDDACAEQ